VRNSQDRLWSLLPPWPRCLRNVIPVLVAFFLGSPPGLSADWPQWRGNGTGVSADKGVPILWHEERSIVWKCPLPERGTSSPVISGDSVFVTTHTDEDKLLLLRIDKKSGQVVWAQEVGRGTAEREGPKRHPMKVHKFYSPASPSPATDGTVVVAHFGNGDLAAFDFHGQRLWKRNLQDDHGGYTSWYGHADSPVVIGDLVISVCMQDSLSDLRAEPIESYLVAHDLRSGDVRWRVTRNTKAEKEECDAYTTPLACTLGGVKQVVVMGANQLDAYDPETGRQLWLLPGLVGGRTVASPTVAGEMIFATRGLRGPLIAVKLHRSELSTRQSRDSQGPAPLVMNFRDLAWSYSEGSPDSCSPLVWNELLFTITDDGIARCFDAASGNLKWKERLKGQYKASPVAAEGRLFFLNLDGLCTVVSASPRFDKLAENKLNDTTIASPAISDGRIYIRGSKTLYCIGR
jgi:outer membrane protein assembly factor BamB